MAWSEGARCWNRSYRNVCVTVCLSMLLSIEASGDEGWPHYLGPNMDFSTGTEKFAAKSATEVWDAKVGTGMCSVTISDGLLYAMGNDGKKDDKDKDRARDSVYCLDGGTGEQKWTFDYQCQPDPRMHPGGPCATPTIHHDKVHTLSKFGHIFCLDARTGKKIWEASAAHYKPSKPW